MTQNNRPSSRNSAFFLTLVVSLAVLAACDFEGSARWPSFTVSFDLNGGTGEAAPITVNMGFEATLHDGIGLFRTRYAFIGWNTSFDGRGETFSAGASYMLIEQITRDGDTPAEHLTLYAMWAPRRGTLVPGTNLASRLSWLQANARSGGEYFMELYGMTPIVHHSLYFDGRSDVTITLIGIGSLIIGIPSNAVGLFSIGSGVTLILDNVTLAGRTNIWHTPRLVRIGNGGALIMNMGSEITGHNGGGVHVFNGGLFEMRGGRIFGNRSGVGVHVDSGGTFRMSNGTIYGRDMALELRNISALSGSGQRGTFDTGGAFSLLGVLSGTDNTIRIANGTFR